MRIVKVLVAIVLVAFTTSARAENCNQSFDIDMSRSLPIDDTLAPFEGWSCQDVERYREHIYIANDSTISTAQFEDLEKWQRSREAILKRIEKAREKIDAAKSAQTTQIAVTIALHEAGLAMAALGCPTAATGVGAVACIGGVVVTQVGTLYSFANLPSGDAARTALIGLETVLKNHDSLSQGELSASQKAFEGSFERLCSIVIIHCRK